MSEKICPECNQEFASFKWCRPCYSTHLENDFDKWTSGDERIDKFIQDAQLDTDKQYKVIDGHLMIDFRILN